ncbi:MAG TPA: uroporphyrinogen decarboxylase family protein, partial [Fimbriimonadaceae bacterium]|nr:uroporphyrinogen decarboxylase family protein [Fimbriimonadaceae bacterium]
MNKRESLLKYLDGGEAGGPAPAAFFMHFGDAYRAGKAAIDRHAEFFRFTGMDFVKIQFELSFPKVEVWSPDGFAGIPSLPLAHYEPMLEVVKGVVEQLGSEALVVLTLYSPFMIAGQMAGNAAVIDGLESDPEPVYAALERITESLSGFVHACKALGLDGFYHSTQGGESRRFKGQETFLKWVKPIDMRLMKAIEAEFKFNILHICDYHAEYGGHDDLTPFLD